MHTDKNFAEALVRFGECAHTAAEIAAGIRGPDTRAHYLTSVIRAMARFFWFTIEFGLMRGSDGFKVYGSGLLSSYGEIAHAIEAPEVQRFRSNWNGPSIKASRSTTISRCSSWWILSITCSAWWINWNAG